tara:strand:- start:269 stop:562 length:294 start_codon:yes stop_codon:yes gene_type:complete
MKIKEIEKEIENIFNDLPEEAQIYINYMENKCAAYQKAIVQTKVKLYKKEYVEAETDLSYIIFNGIDLYRQEELNKEDQQAIKNAENPDYPTRNEFI